MGGWTGRRLRDIVHIGDSSFSVTFDLIQEAYNGFFVTGAEWVGIWGIAFSELAKVRLCGVCVCAHAHLCVMLACGPWDGHQVTIARNWNAAS